MLLSEEKAKTKWCFRTGKRGANCVGSDCMAWRSIWTTTTILANGEPPDGENDWKPDGPTFEVEGNTFQRWKVQRGFCGLASKPFD